ncbi:unnamed protein product [Arabis nemorensis]|uniref:KIB1-4 beta-propeller domain-containing protein n=1 Tax=Arabis nemorensis TaxID=586526 RepID=A0A565CTV5_9BRAS|nr:unnamed protein product [Arabis nemorensis]
MPTKPDFSGFRYLANSGKWFLTVDPGLNLFIIDIFSEKKIHLPPLESIEDARFRLVREGDKELKQFTINGNPSGTAEDVRGVLWVDENNKQELVYVVVWRFDTSRYIGFCKNGYDIHLGTPTHTGLSRENGFKDVSDNHSYSMNPSPLIDRDSTPTSHRIFCLFKRDPNQDPDIDMDLVEVDSLGDEALFLDLGIIVPADETLGIEPNSIYFTRDDRVRNKKCRCLDIFVYNLATKTFKCFHSLSSLNPNDALWFIPS